MSYKGKTFKTGLIQTFIQMTSKLFKIQIKSYMLLLHGGGSLHINFGKFWTKKINARKLIKRKGQNAYNLLLMFVNNI